MRSSRNASQNGCDVGVGHRAGLRHRVAAHVSPLQDQRGLLAHDPAGARDVRGVVLAQLAVVAAALDLARRLDHQRHAAGEPGLTDAELPPWVLHGKSPLYERSWSRTNGMPFARAAETGVLDREQDRDRVAVVELHHVDVAAAQIRSSRTPVSATCEIGVRGIVDRVRRRLVREVLTETGDEHAAVRRASRARSCWRARTARRRGTASRSREMCSGSAIMRRLEHVVGRDRFAEEHGRRGWRTRSCAGRPRSWPAPSSSQP